MKKAVTFVLTFLIILIGEVNGQVEYKWVDVGSFHNFYSNIGSEIEWGFISDQQAGWQWPAIYHAQDAQASKALWLGVKNFVDSSGTTYERRVVHVGPRVTGIGEFFPIEFKLISKYHQPQVYVNDNKEDENEMSIDEIDPDLIADRMLYSKMNTLLGITVERKVLQFSQQYHDNYHIIEYIFTNTGNTDEDLEIELPGQSLEGFVPFFKNQWAPVKQTRYTIGIQTGWGINTMYDRRGDGLRPEEPEKFRASFAWHGYFPNSDVYYDNIGAPIIIPNTTGGYLSIEDTTGRLGAYHFVGSVTLHADASANNETDNPSQPFTMAYEHNDDQLFSNNDAFDVLKMKHEYTMMTKGRVARHAYKVEPTGYDGFIEPSGDPSLGNGGGHSSTSGYGPYDLDYGESVRIVVAEATSGISRLLAAEAGNAFKKGEIDRKQKNEIVFQGRDSLFQTFERAIENYNSGYQIPMSPQSPSRFEVNSSDTGIVLSWDYDELLTENIQGFEIFRASGKVDSTYQLLYRASKDERIVVDGEPSTRRNYQGEYFLESPKRGTSYFYYIITKGEVNKDSTGKTPTGSRLVSNRYYTQTYQPSRTFQPVGTEIKREIPDRVELFQNYPNPFNPSTTISFYIDQSSKVKIQVFNMLGQKIATLTDAVKSAGKHNLRWNAEGLSSGIYFYQLNVEGKETLTKQLILMK